MLTNDQYIALSMLNHWYRKYNQQIIDISGTIGTGLWELIREFVEGSKLDSREVMYLSLNQREVLDLAYQRYHSYHLNNVLYRYDRLVNFDTIPVINPNSRSLEINWRKKLRGKVDPKYKLIVVFDSSLLSHQTILDLSSFYLPIILLRDPMLIPIPETYTFLRDPNIELNEISDRGLKSPINYFAHKILRGERLEYGTYGSVNVIPRKQFNLNNLKTSDMVVTISSSLRDELNKLYREKVMKRKDIINVVNERVIVANTLYKRKLKNPDNEKVKVYLTKGSVGYLTKVNKHPMYTKYVGVDFKPDFYHETFTDLMMDRHHLNKIDASSQQLIPDEIFQVDYAYALSAVDSRLGYWDKVTLVIDNNELDIPELQRRLIYTAITRAKRSLTIIL